MRALQYNTEGIRFRGLGSVASIPALVSTEASPCFSQCLCCSGKNLGDSAHDARVRPHRIESEPEIGNQRRCPAPVPPLLDTFLLSAKITVYLGKELASLGGSACSASKSVVPRRELIRDAHASNDMLGDSGNPERWSLQAKKNLATV